MPSKILTFSQSVQLKQALTRGWLEIARRSIAERGRFTVALCGGTTPRSFYRYIAKHGGKHLWSHTHIFITDERFVSRSHPENNGRMITESLLKYIKIPRNNVHFINTDNKTVRSSAVGYGKELNAFFHLRGGSLPKFDLILLGVGEDGHTASLFPHAKATVKTEKRSVVFSLNPSGTQWRISLSLPVINNARHVFFLVTGKKKAGVIKNVLCDEKCQLPAALVVRNRKKVEFFLDGPAGSFLDL